MQNVPKATHLAPKKCRRAIYCTYTILIFLFGASCTSGDSATPSLKDNNTTIHDSNYTQQTLPVVQPEQYNYNIYIENSGSMDGYVNGITEFEQSVYNILADIKISHSTDSLNLFYINTDIIPIHSNATIDQITDFIDKLEPTTFIQSGGNREETELNNIVKNALNSVDSNTISVIVSDYIFSPGSNANAQEYLIHQQIGLKTLFADKAQTQNMSTLFLKFRSKFQGYYYDRNNTKIDFTKKIIQRPFYMMFVGPNAALKQIIRLISNPKYQERGFEQFCYFQSQGSIATDTNKASLPKLSYKYKKGEFEISVPPTSMKLFKAQTEQDVNGKLNFRFSIIVDYSDIICDTDYLTNSNNYNVFPVNYTLSVEKIPDNDRLLKGYTHLLKISTDKFNNTIDSVSIQLKNRYPIWVDTTSSEDDSGIETSLQQQSKTFGLKYLIGGIEDAYTYNDHNEYLFKTDVLITQAAKSSSRMNFLLPIILVLLLIAYIIFRVLKHN